MLSLALAGMDVIYGDSLAALDHHACLPLRIALAFYLSAYICLRVLRFCFVPASVCGFVASHCIAAVQQL